MEQLEMGVRFKQSPPLVERDKVYGVYLTKLLKLPEKFDDWWPIYLKMRREGSRWDSSVNNGHRIWVKHFTPYAEIGNNYHCRSIWGDVPDGGFGRFSISETLDNGFKLSDDKKALLCTLELHQDKHEFWHQDEQGNPQIYRVELSNFST